MNLDSGMPDVGDGGDAGPAASVQILTFVNGPWRQNCYLAVRESEALVIDPGSQADDLIDLIEVNQLRVTAILATHAHFDHIGAAAALIDRYGAPFYLHRADELLLKRANLYRLLFESRQPVRIPALTCDISVLPPVFGVGPFSVSWLPTPGHTEGSVCFRVETLLFSGDTLMRGCVGRTDLPGGDRGRLLSSVRELMTLPGETIVYGGHGPQTTLAAEFTPGTPVWSLFQ